MIDPGLFVECCCQFIDHQFNRRIADCVNTGLPASGIQGANRGRQRVRVNTEFAAIFRFALVGLPGIRRRPGESAIDEYLDRADAKILVERAEWLSVRLSQHSTAEQSRAEQSRA